MKMPSIVGKRMDSKSHSNQEENEEDEIGVCRGTVTGSHESEKEREKKLLHKNKLTFTR